MSALSEEEVDCIRLQMLCNLTNGWSWYAYKRVGPEEIIELEIIKQELEMGEEQLPPAVDILLQLVQPEGTPIEKTRQALAQVSAINAYVPRFLEGTPKYLKLEYAACPNWSALQRLGYEDYLSIDGEPAWVSRIHGCTRVHEIYFRQIEPGVETAHFEPRPEKDATAYSRPRSLEAGETTAYSLRSTASTLPSLSICSI